MGKRILLAFQQIHHNSDIEKGWKYVLLSQKELESMFLGMFLWNSDVGYANAHSLNHDSMLQNGIQS